MAQLSGYVSENAAYHHGEASLQATIVNMAQNFVGSNNVNLLQPQGQFGTRLEGGKDAASARYITTYLTPLARLVFPKADDAILDYLEDDGLSVEPKWYVPVLPLVLCNGNKGIGTGWSSTVPNYNPRDIVANIVRVLSLSLCACSLAPCCACSGGCCAATTWCRCIPGTAASSGDTSGTRARPPTWCAACGAAWTRRRSR